MIRFENVTKSFHVPGGGRKYVAKDVSVEFPSGVSIGLLGRNGAGKSTLLDMIGGTVVPDEGRVVRHGSVSWAVGFSGSFHGDMTGAQNTRFIARVYGVDTDSLLKFVEGFAELGSHFYLPYRTYSSGMRARLAFGVSMGIPFDTYLVDEVTSVGDAAIRSKSQIVFDERMQTSGAIVVTHSPDQLRKLCTAGAVLEKGRLIYFDDLEEAIALHTHNMGTVDMGEG